MSVSRHPISALLLTLALLSGACGAEGDGATGPDTVEPADEPEVLRVIMADDWVVAPAVVDAVSAFEAAHPGLRVVLQDAPFSQIPDLAASASASGRPYDVIHQHAFGLAETGQAQAVTDLWEEHGITAEEWLPGAVEDVTWKGERYGIPLDTNALVLLVNRDLLTAAGATLADLRTFDGFSAAARAIVEATDAEGFAMTASSWPVYGWVRAFGGEILVEEGARLAATLDAPEVVAAVQGLAALIDDGAAIPPNARDVSTDASTLFQSGLVGMHASGSWDLALLERAPVDFEVATVPLPRASAASDTGTVLGGSSLAVGADARDRDLAFDFMLHLTEDDLALRLAAEEGRLPARARVFDDALFAEPGLDVVVAELPVASAMKLVAFPAAEEAFKEALEDAILGRRDAAAALREAQQVATSVIAGDP